MRPHSVNMWCSAEVLAPVIAIAITMVTINRIYLLSSTHVRSSVKQNLGETFRVSMHVVRGCVAGAAMALGIVSLVQAVVIDARSRDTVAFILYLGVCS
jgi:hypothetical protein